MSRIQYQNARTAVADDIEEHNKQPPSPTTPNAWLFHPSIAPLTYTLKSLIDELAVVMSGSEAEPKFDYKYEACL